MSLYDYRLAQQVVMNDVPFYALIMAAMTKADSANIIKLQQAFPDVYSELSARYNEPGGKLDHD